MKPLAPREQLLGSLAEPVVAAIEKLVEETVEERLARDEPELVRVSEAAARMGVTTKALDHRIRRGQVAVEWRGGLRFVAMAGDRLV